MTGPLFVVTRWFLSALPVDAAGRRVFDETLADWKSEASNARGLWGTFTVSLRAIVSVLRSVLMTSSRELSSREGLAPLLRLATWSIVSVLLFVAFNWNWSLPVNGVPVAIGPAAVWLGSVHWIVALMPLLAFISAASGRRASRAPRLGSALVAGAVMLGAMGWAAPAANQVWRELVFALNGGNGTILPGINERSIVELVGLLATRDFPRAASVLNLRLVFIAAAPVLLVLGLTARSLPGRWRLAATVLPLLVFAIPFLMRIDSPYGHASSWPAMIAAVFVSRAIVRRAETHAVVA